VDRGLATQVGKDLAVAIFGTQGNYRMGLSEGEKQGWQFLAQRSVERAQIRHRRAIELYGLCGSASAGATVECTARWLVRRS